MYNFQNKCFIISEIGEPGSPERARADKFKKIVEAALDRVAKKVEPRVEAERLDGDRTVDNFFNQVLDRILRHRLVVAVLSNKNPNAHLELGLALAAGRPVTILIEKHKATRWDIVNTSIRRKLRAQRFADLPSDLKGYRCVECALPETPDGEVDKAAVEELADIMVAQLGKGEPTMAFDRLHPFGKRSAVDYLNRANELSFDQWSRLLWDADDYIAIAATSFRFLVENRMWFYSRSALHDRDLTGQAVAPDCILLDILIEKAALEGARVRLFLVSPDNPFLEHLLHSRDGEEHARELQRVRTEITDNLGRIRGHLSRSRTSKTPKSPAPSQRHGSQDEDRRTGFLDLIEIEKGSLFSRVTITDKAGFITPYHLIEPFNTGPAFWVQKTKIVNDRGEQLDNNLYVKTIEDLDELYELNRDGIETATNDQLRALLGQHPRVS